MLLFLTLLLCYTAAQAGKLPEFNDPIHGLLIVSRKNPPFLTLKAHPNVAYYVPTDEQVKIIRNAVYGSAFRFKRHSNDNIVYNNSSSVPVKMELRLGLDEEDESDLNLSPEDFEIGMKTYALYAKFIGQMIIGMYKGYFDLKPQAPSDLPFEASSEKTYFKATVVPTVKMPQWHEDVYRTLKLHAQNRPYFPVEKIIRELLECRTVGYSEVSDKDFQFKSDMGGIMTYYKVKCMKIKTNTFVFFALSDNEFRLTRKQPVKPLNTEDGKCECEAPLCWMTECSSKICTSKKEMFQENRHLTAEQQKELSDYLVERVIEIIINDNKHKIEMANGESLGSNDECDLDCIRKA